MNQKRYWLRGGILAVLILFIVSLIIIGLSYLMRDIGILFFIFLLAAPGLLLNFFTGCDILPSFGGGSSPNCPIGQTMYENLVIAISLLVYFVIGAIIGWRYGVNKSKETTTRSPKKVIILIFSALAFIWMGLNSLIILINPDPGMTGGYRYLFALAVLLIALASLLIFMRTYRKNQ